MQKTVTAGLYISTKLDILLYTEKITPRLDYIVGLILGKLLGLNYSVTCSLEEFNDFKGACINYSDRQLDNCLRIVPCGLLSETGIKKQMVEVDEWEGLKILFPSNINGAFPFDLFAACFYMVSRYEEYLPFNADEHGRFKATQSIAWQQGFLEKPVVNLWTQKLKDMLLGKYPDLPVRQGKFTYISTIDIDNAWAFKNKGFLRASGAMLRSFFQLNFSDLKYRISVLRRKSSDPYYTYDYLEKQEKKYGFSSIYFFLVGKYGRYDTNISFSNKNFRNLILQKSKKGTIGVHPSYRSNEVPGELKKEVWKLNGLLGEEIQKSRQHFLMIRFPDTFERLIEVGLSEDYSLGYASHIGFRAGICTPFHFYDLRKEEKTKLIMVPFMVMDITMQQYMGLTPVQAEQEIRKMIDSVKAVDGTFVSLWHNESLSGTGIWKDWREVYEKMLKYVYD